MRRFAPWAAIFVLALALRLVYLVQIQAVPLTQTLVGDAFGYDRWARRILAGDWMGTEAFYQAPAYPYFMAVVYKVFGAASNVVRVVQCVLGAVACLFLGMTAREFFDRRTGLVAAALLAVYPPAIFFCGLIQKTALMIFFLTALLAVTAAVRRAPSVAKCVLAGVLLALLSLTRENALVLAAVIVGWLAMGLREHAVRRRAGWAAAFVAGLAAPLLLVAWRNFHVGRVWAVTTVQAGPNFWIGNNPNAIGTYVPLVPGHESVAYERSDARKLAEEGAGRPLTDKEVSDYWLSESFEFIRAEPWKWLRLMGRKLLLAINSFEVPDTEGYGVYRAFAWMLEVMASLLHFGIIVPVAAVGMALTWSRRRQLALLYAMSAILLASIVLFYLFGRYRFPLVPFAVMFAAAGVVEAVRRWRARDSRGVLPAVVAGVIAAAAANAPIIDGSALDALQFQNVALVLAGNQHVEGAGVVLDVALEQRGDIVKLHYSRAIVHRLAGEPQEAIARLMTVRRLSPQEPDVAIELALNYEALGDREQALAWYRQALREHPNDADARAGLQRLAPP
jgi:4-amino-4-deoxy-L-arabinose transferase-like glycosyltransferase